jgi:hypothetical protein
VSYQNSWADLETAIGKKIDFWLVALVFLVRNNSIEAFFWL